MSKSVESTASCQRLARIGNTLDRADDANTRANIVSWISDNPKILGRLWQLMETELIWELMGNVNEKHLPRSCTRISLLSATLEKVLINRNLPVSFTRQLIKLMKTKDSKVMDKMFAFKFQFDKKYPMKSGPAYKNLFDITDHRNTVLGKRLDRVVVGLDGSVDFGKYGNYGFALLRDGETQYEPLEDKASFHTATRILHRSSNFGVALDALGCPTPTDTFIFIDNHDEQKTQVSNGLRMRIALWDDFKANPYFDYDKRFAAAWGQ